MKTTVDLLTFIRREGFRDETFTDRTNVGDVTVEGNERRVRRGVNEQT